MQAFAKITAIAARSHRTLVQDALGASALFAILFVSLHIPAFL